jgi:hypothetical protein
MCDSQLLNHQTILSRDHVVVAVVREVGSKPVAALTRLSVPDGVRNNEIKLVQIQRLAWSVKRATERRLKEFGGVATCTMQEEDGVVDTTGGVSMRPSQRDVV